MRIAYLLTAYKDSKHLNNLIDSLNYNADFYIHIDLKVNINPFINTIGKKKNVYFIKKRYFVNWGSFAQVLCQKELLSIAINSGIVYDRVVCLSGMDYPIWSMNKIINEFNNNLSKEYIMESNV